LSFLENEFFKKLYMCKKNAMLHIIFTAAAVESLPGVATGRERGGGRAGSSY
jgi:hypothetical protein